MNIKMLSLIIMMSTTMIWSQNKSPWQKQTANVNQILKESHKSLKEFKTFSLNSEALRQSLNGVINRNQFSVNSNVILSFPNSEGKLERFAIKEASVMHPDLQERYPDIRSYVGQGIDDGSAILRFSLSPEGFNGMILSTKGNTFIEPISHGANTYIVFNRTNRIDYNNDFECSVSERIKDRVDSQTNIALRNADDSILRTYRLAVSATGEYTQYHGGTKAQALSAINTTMTRVNGIFEVDFNVTMILIANTDDVIYTSTSTDPYGNTTSGYNTALQNTLTSVIGEANYDIGHLFANLQNNGNAGCIGCVCVNNQKGSGWTSATNPVGDFFDVDYVAHEMGHQFGANHTWTFGGNEGTNVQVEPGSGTTIMSYAGITGSTDVEQNVTPNFHAVSIEQVTDYIKSTSCQTNTNTGNSVPVVNAGPNYTIPRGTPFILEGSATDADASDVLSYVWEQMDENNASTTLPSTSATTGVAFRAYEPTTNPNRYFPRLETIKAGATSWQWEAVPNVARTLNFRLTVRDNVAGGGTNNSDDVVLTVNANAGPFVVNSPNTNVTWNAGTTQTVTWNVAGTTGNGVNAANVDILLSTDGGDTYPIILASGVPNDGSQDIVVPNNQGNQNRIMVRGSNHIFFDISNTNFTIAGQVVCNATVPTGIAASNIAETTATLSWDAVPGATYELRYRPTGTSTWNTSAVTGISSNVTGLTALTEYEAQVRSLCSGGSSSAFSSSVIFTTTDVQLNYCNSASTNVNDEFISRVQLNTIDNSSGAQFYSDFTSISTTLTKGSQYTVTITPTWTGTVYAEGYSVWIDYNRDGDFTDAGEQVFTQAPTQATPVSGNFTVPSSAIENSTRMRVTLSYNANVGPCDSFTYGEVEDYTIIIEGAGPDTTPPVITLNGDSVVNVTQGGTYTELGATAIDNVDGDISSNIVIGGDTVNTSLLGTYVVTYNVSDTAGNDAVEVTRTVTVIEPSNGCSGGVSTFPYSESFENTLGDWTQSSDDDIDWTINANGTPSSNTGPTSAADGTFYVYVEASSPNYPSRRAILNSPCFDLNGVASASFNFQYHMFGAADMGTIDLEISNDEGTTWTSIWSQSGNQGNQWNSQSVSLDAYVGSGVQLRFNRFVGSTWQADIAIDDVSLTTSGPDVTPPVITLNGPSTLDLNVGDTYTEQGATATDNVDGDLTSSIVIGGDVVNTSIAGIYVVTYNVSDAAGNAATEVTRTVTVIADTTPPVITLIGASTINLELGDSYTDQGATATDNVDGNLTSSIIIGGDNVNTSIVGSYVVTYNVSDAAGNAAAEVIRTVNVNPDTTAPIITLIGANPVNLNVGETYNELGATATDNLDGDISANIIITGSVNTAVAGTYFVNYNVSDSSGNTATQVTRTVNVLADTTPPVIVLIGSATINLNVGDSYTELGATATDNLDGDITANIVIGGSVNTGLAGTYQVTYNVSDAAGNAATQVIRTINVTEPSTGCSGGISTYPYTEGFEGSIGAWTQSVADDIDWTVNSNGTPSSGTGPSGAIEGSSYIYVEASGNNVGYPNKRAIITSPCFDLSGLTNPIFSFSYHMFGATDMGSIDLELSDDGGATWTSLWNQTGNQGDQWLKVDIDLSAYIGSNVQVRFNRFVGSTWQADIAVDDVRLLEPAAPTCDDGIQNGDETGVDCGGSSCAPCSTSNVILNEGFFETGWDNWIDGGSDCARVSSANSYEGNFSIQIRDNSGVASSMTLDNIDVTPYGSVEIDFYFYVLSMETGEDFWVRYFDGTSWNTVATYTSGVNINNNTFYNATVALTPAEYNFAVNSGFRFQNDASGNNDQIFIDQVTITGVSSGSRGKGDSLEAVGYLDSPELSEADINIYPNPVKGSILNVEVSNLEVFKYKIVNIQGRTILSGISDGKIDVSELDGGIYFIEVNDGDEIVAKKFIKN
jgi:hypothetical protein